MNCLHQTVKAGMQPGNPAEPRETRTLGVVEQCAAGGEARGRQEGRLYTHSQQAIHEIRFFRVLLGYKGKL